ncbi:hypothetical protein PHAVU_009G089500 [Phaseolus vulgaris]|uniref:Protein kinase domain-containing protein n=1 Tax=Phaseolus vulgaris TaxID=3885 RepID=V7ATI4_PHAVU|nr:hypothetical protein PHAVU_009G089500g [Phaseolus vulgaris]ESW08967.1 hypothetical protein PHAVU_009G089500g [Phaseolus vulgaris]
MKMNLLFVFILLLHYVAAADPPASSPQPPPFFSPGKEQHHLNKKMLIAIVVATTSLAALIFSFLCFWIYHTKSPTKSKTKKVQTPGPDAEKGITLAPFLSRFSSVKIVGMKESVPIVDYKQIEKTTNNFLESNILGEGGFGRVYKARLDHNLDVAVKKLHCETQHAEREFENEVNLLSKIQHPNIISLLGCSIDGDTRFIVYELMQNGSLEAHLHGPTHGSALTWYMRMKIALDTAKGLEYLHEHCYPAVIHRDMKSSNILLDANFNAKLSDFGLAITDGSQSKKNIKLSGTLGYVAPEYLLDGKLSDKSDVYAFGVVLLELLLGRKPVEKLAPTQCQSIVTWAMPQLTDRAKLPNIVDPVIKNTMDPKHLYQVAAVAVLCVQPEPSYRPLITDVLHSLIPLVPMELGGTLRVSQVK